MFRERITRRYQSLSPSFKKIADFVLTSHQRAAFMSASRMAKHLGVDVATVTRFAQQIGYDGYIELSREIQEKVLKEMREIRAPVREKVDAAEGQFAQTLWRDWANLEKTIENISEKDADKAMDALRRARRIYVVSEGVGAGLAQAMGSYFSMAKAEVFVLTAGAFDLALSLKEMGSEDVIIALGFTNYAYAASRALELGRKVGATTIGVIAQPNCPIAGPSDILFSCSATEEGYFPTPTAVASILFALAYGFMVGDVDHYSHNLVRFQEAYADLTEGTARGEDDVVPDLIGRF